MEVFSGQAASGGTVLASFAGVLALAAVIAAGVAAKLTGRAQRKVRAA